MAKKTAQKKSDITKRVDRIERKLDKLPNPKIYLGGRADSFTLSSDVSVTNLTRLAGDLTAIFGTSTDDLQSNKIRLSRLMIKYYMWLYNEPDGPYSGEVFIVSPRADAASKITFSTGAMTLTSNDDYWIRNGMVFLNPEVFEIHAHKKFHLMLNGVNGATTPAYTTPAQTCYGTDFVFEADIKLAKNIQNPAGNAISLACPTQATSNIYLLIFNNNSAVDGESPKAVYTTVFYGNATH